MPVTAVLAQYICDWKRLLYELLHSKPNETIYVPSEDTYQNENPPILIRVIPVHLMTKAFCMILETAGCKDRIIAFVMQWRISFWFKPPSYQPSLINTKVK